MTFNLAAMARRTRNIRRRSITLPPIAAPATFATSLYRECYAPIVEAAATAVPRIVAEYERSLSELTTDSPSDLSRVLDLVAGEMARLVLTLTPRLRGWAFRVERHMRRRWIGVVLSVTGVSLDTLIGPETARETLETAIARNVALIRDVGAQAQGRIAEAVFRGLTQRQPAREVATAIREATAMARHRSIRIASHQLSALSAQLAAERRREAGLTIFKHRHSGKLHPREHHKARDGKLFSERAEDVGREVEGQRVNAAPPADDRAGIPPFCGCREQGCIVFD